MSPINVIQLSVRLEQVILRDDEDRHPDERVPELPHAAQRV